MTSNSRHGLPPRLMANQPTRFTAAQESKPSPSPGIRMTSEVRDNPEGGRFELDIGGQAVFARYARHGSLLVIPYVEAPPPLRGTGAASQLMTGGMAIARAEGLKVRPLCSYASAWIRRHSKYHDLLG